MKEDKYILVNPALKFVRGSLFNLIIDIQRNECYRFDNHNFDFILNIDRLTQSQIYLKFPKEIDIVKENIQLLIDREIISLQSKSTISCFDSVELKYDMPARIENAIIHLSNENFETIISRPFMESLANLGIMALNIRGKTMLVLRFVENIQMTKARHLEIIFTDNFSTDNSHIENLFHKIPILHACWVSKLYEKEEFKKCNVYYFDQDTELTKSCGKVGTQFFSINDLHYINSNFHNSCLYKKISIDTEGNIKNCPSMTESYGNIRDTTLAEAIEKPGFKKYWDINKDQIHVCKDCEFRYICTDCRAYVEDPADILSKPLKCGYNPYTGEWSEWSTNPLKQKAIDFYGMREMVESTD